MIEQLKRDSSNTIQIRIWICLENIGPTRFFGLLPYKTQHMCGSEWLAIINHSEQCYLKRKPQVYRTIILWSISKLGMKINIQRQNKCRPV